MLNLSERSRLYLCARLRSNSSPYPCELLQWQLKCTKGQPLTKRCQSFPYPEADVLEMWQIKAADYNRMRRTLPFVLLEHASTALAPSFVGREGTLHTIRLPGKEVHEQGSDFVPCPSVTEKGSFIQLRTFSLAFQISVCSSIQAAKLSKPPLCTVR